MRMKTNSIVAGELRFQATVVDLENGKFGWEVYDVTNYNRVEGGEAATRLSAFMNADDAASRYVEAVNG